MPDAGGFAGCLSDVGQLLLGASELEFLLMLNLGSDWLCFGDVGDCLRLGRLSAGILPQILELLTFWHVETGRQRRSCQFRWPLHLRVILCLSRPLQPVTFRVALAEAIEEIRWLPVDPLLRDGII